MRPVHERVVSGKMSYINAIPRSTPKKEGMGLKKIAISRPSKNGPLPKKEER